MKTWEEDLMDLHAKFGVGAIVEKMPPDVLKAFLEFRKDFIAEECTELRDATTADGVVDALIDLCVVAVGTLEAFNVDVEEAWRRVHEKNMQKLAGENSGRKNAFGFPDLVKPQGWTPPDHRDNVGLLSLIFDESK